MKRDGDPQNCCLATSEAVRYTFPAKITAKDGDPSINVPAVELTGQNSFHLDSVRERSADTNICSSGMMESFTLP
jgi:hypothetical protein